MDSALDLLQQAAVKLSQSGSIKERLADAYAAHLSDLDLNELPDAVRSEFSKLSVAMQRERPLPRESVVRASVRKMSNEEAAYFAALVVRSFCALARSSSGAGVTGQRRAGRNAAATAPIVQLFAAEG
jgi:hypothetical protein